MQITDKMRENMKGREIKPHTLELDDNGFDRMGRRHPEIVTIDGIHCYFIQDPELVVNPVFWADCCWIIADYWWRGPDFDIKPSAKKKFLRQLERLGYENWGGLKYIYRNTVRIQEEIDNLKKISVPGVTIQVVCLSDRHWSRSKIISSDDPPYV